MDIKILEKVFEEAEQEALKYNLPILKRINNKLYILFPNGNKKFIKKLPSVKVKNKVFNI